MDLQASNNNISNNINSNHSSYKHFECSTMASDITTSGYRFPSKLMEIILGFQTSQVLITGVELGIFDCIESQPGASATAHQLAALLNLDEAALIRLLDMCVASGVLTKSCPGREFLYNNTAETKQHLITSSSKSLNGFIIRMKSQMVTMMNLADAIKNGQAAVVPADIDTTGQVDGEKLEYNDSMARMASPALVSAFDLSHFQSACDLAGGIGGLVSSLKQSYPNMSVSVMEQAQVVDYAIRNGKHLSHDGEQLISFIKGNILIDQLPDCDLFLMGHMCMLLSDEMLMKLLSKIYAALPSGGGLLMCESILNEDHAGPLLTSHRDIAELLVSSHGERTATEYRQFLNAVGFREIKVHMFEPHICYDLIFAKKTP